MKILDVSNISTTVAMPIKSGTLQFLQDSYKETIEALAKTIIPNSVNGTMYILSGCVNTGVLPIHDISAGYLLYNGEVFQFDGASFTLSGIEKAYARIETTQYTTNADPVTFSDAIPRNVHNIRKIVIENTVVDSGLPEFKDFYKYGVLESDNETDGVLTTSLNPDVNYTVTFQRQGNLISITIEVISVGASTTGDVFSIDESKFHLKSIANGNPIHPRVYSHSFSGGGTVQGQLVNNVFSILGLPNPDLATFNFTYPAE